MQPLVPVAMPGVNGLPHLTALVTSLPNQTYANIDVIFTEVGVTDIGIDSLRSIEVQVRDLLGNPQTAIASAQCNTIATRRKILYTPRNLAGFPTEDQSSTEIDVIPKNACDAYQLSLGHQHHL